LKKRGSNLGVTIAVTALLLSLGLFIFTFQRETEFLGNATEQGAGRVILDVPFVLQKEWYCSEASASMVLRYYGHDLSQDQINEMGYDRFENMLPLLAKYVNCKYAFLTMEDLKREIDEGDPVIIRILPGSFLHTIVVVGYNNKYIYVHDPAVGPKIPVDPQALLFVWRFTKYAAIIFSPEQRGGK